MLNIRCRSMDRPTDQQPLMERQLDHGAHFIKSAPSRQQTGIQRPEHLHHNNNLMEETKSHRLALLGALQSMHKAQSAQEIKFNGHRHRNCMSHRFGANMRPIRPHKTHQSVQNDWTETSCIGSIRKCVMDATRITLDHIQRRFAESK